jgi:uncharacterized protein YrrD
MSELRSFRAVRGLPVVTLKEGAHAGKLEDFYFSLADARVLGFRVRVPGFWGGDAGIAAGEVSLLGRDYVLASASAVVEAGHAEAPENSRAWWSGWVGSPVLCRRGAQIGKIEDAMLALGPARVVGFGVDGGRVLFPGPRVVVGVDSVVVEDDALVLSFTERPDSPEWWAAVAARVPNGSGPTGG